MKIVDQQITLEELKTMAQRTFGQIVKAVIDIERDTLVVDAQMHSDQEELLLDQGSQQEHLWGINLHPFESEDKFVEFFAVINLRPLSGNMSMSVNDVTIQKRIIALVNQKISR